MAQTVEIIKDTGAGRNVVDRTIPTTGFSVKLNGQLYSPAITSNVEMENDGGVDQTSDQCGNTERSRELNKGWNVRVKGIITSNDDRSGNLSLQLLRDVIGPRDSIKIRSDVTGSSVVDLQVSNVVITHSSDLVSIRTTETDGKEKAFDFNMQLGETSAE